MNVIYNKLILFLFILIMPVSAVQAQSYNSVPLGHEAYYIIETGVMRGVITQPPSARPWPVFIIKEKLLEMLDNPLGKLSAHELNILKELLASFDRKNGLDLQKGMYMAENTIKGRRLSLDTGLNWESNVSVKVPQPSVATIHKGTFFFTQNIADLFSWKFSIDGGFLYIDREILGIRPNPPYIDPNFGDYDGNPNSSGHYYTYDIPPASFASVYAVPAMFPNTFTKPWDSLLAVDNPQGNTTWPDSFAFFYQMSGELGSGFFYDHLLLRFGRMRRDWGPGGNGASLYLNSSARPMMGIECSALPFRWLYFSLLGSSLEYTNDQNEEISVDPYQNMLLMALLEFNLGKHFNINAGVSSVFAKRFEPGYFFSNDNSFLQNSAGNYDNAAFFIDMVLRFLNTKLWLSIFLDDLSAMEKNFLFLNQNKYAYQAGIKSNISLLPFGLITFRYTKIEPYCYTFDFRETPGRSAPVDTSYINDGESIGFYLSPNSDELLFRMESMPLRQLTVHIQYQLIRHGVDWGQRRVAGSSIRDKTPEKDSQKFFLKDGAYEWNHLFKIGSSFSLTAFNIPIAFFAEAGLVVTRFFDTNVELGMEGNYTAIDTPVYRAGNNAIFSIGVRVFPDI